MLQERNITLKNMEQVKLTKNNTTMEHENECVEEVPKSKHLIGKINQVWLWKRSMIPCEIMWLDRTKVMDGGETNKEQSLMK